MELDYIADYLMVRGLLLLLCVFVTTKEENVLDSMQQLV